MYTTMISLQSCKTENLTFKIYPFYNITPVYFVASLNDLPLCVSGIEKDAVIIFTKYVSPDAVRPIPITEQIRNDIVGKIQ